MWNWFKPVGDLPKWFHSRNGTMKSRNFTAKNKQIGQTFPQSSRAKLKKVETGVFSFACRQAMLTLQTGSYVVDVFLVGKPIILGADQRNVWRIDVTQINFRRSFTAIAIEIVLRIFVVEPENFSIAQHLAVVENVVCGGAGREVVQIDRKSSRVQLLRVEAAQHEQNVLAKVVQPIATEQIDEERRKPTVLQVEKWVVVFEKVSMQLICIGQKLDRRFDVIQTKDRRQCDEWLHHLGQFGSCGQQLKHDQGSLWMADIAQSVCTGRRNSGWNLIDNFADNTIDTHHGPSCSELWRLWRANRISTFHRTKIAKTFSPCSGQTGCDWPNRCCLANWPATHRNLIWPSRRPNSDCHCHRCDLRLSSSNNRPTCPSGRVATESVDGVHFHSSWDERFDAKLGHSSLPWSPDEIRRRIHAMWSFPVPWLVGPDRPERRSLPCF